MTESEIFERIKPTKTLFELLMALRKIGSITGSQTVSYERLIRPVIEAVKTGNVSRITRTGELKSKVAWLAQQTHRPLVDWYLIALLSEESLPVASPTSLMEWFTCATSAAEAGLTEGQRYGEIPLVRQVEDLRDSIIALTAEL
ncbi:MAG TPA: hypothetical protein VGE59_03140 [Patescibacteria group bacterium]